MRGAVQLHAHAAEPNGTTDFQESSTPKKAVVITLGSLGLIALGATVATNVQELMLTSRRNDLLASYGNAPGGNAQCGTPEQCASLRDLNDSIEGTRSRWTPFAITTATLFTATLATLLLWPAEERYSALRIVPTIGQQSGVAVGGRF